MKLTKWLTPILTSTLAITGVSVGLVGCGNSGGDTPQPEPEPPTPEAYEQYISDRTFSILGIASEIGTPYAVTVLGTCWIIDDATASNADDYIYYVATNWHVTHGNDLLIEDPTLGNIQYKYADNSLTDRTDKIIDFRKYIEFASCERQDDENFLYSNPQPTTYFEPCIDFHVYKVNFGNPTGSIKEKLDTLNVLKQKTGKINTFVAGDDENIKKKTKYIAGYPAKQAGDEAYGGRWETHSIEANQLIYCDKGSVSWEGYAGPGHAIGTPDKNQIGQTIAYKPGTETEEFYKYDISPQYECIVNKGSDWMTGGASGSMLLTQDYEICGIYWGGSSTGQLFYPFFSLFKTTDKDFIETWIN